MISRRTVIAFSLALVAGCGLLAWFASRDVDARAYSLQVPFNRPAASLGAGQRACEGPLASPVAVGGVRVWGLAGGSPAGLEVLVGDAQTGRMLARGSAPVGVGFDALTATLTDTLAARRPLMVCFVATGAGGLSLFGSARPSDAVRLTVDGAVVPREISIVLLGARRTSLLSLLPTIFARAALFRPGWVGAWTFWVLTLALLAGALALGTAVAHAAGDEERRALSDQR